MPICLPLHHNKEKKQQKTKKSKHNNWRKPEFNCMFEKKARTHSYTWNIHICLSDRWLTTHITWIKTHCEEWITTYFIREEKKSNKTPLNKQKTTNHKLRNSWACQRKCTSFGQANCNLDSRWNFQYDSMHLEGNQFNAIYLEIILSLERLNSFISKKCFVYHCTTSDWFQIYYQALIPHSL